jgi:hypothetical protein
MEFMKQIPSQATIILGAEIHLPTPKQASIRQQQNLF